MTNRPRSSRTRNAHAGHRAPSRLPWLIVAVVVAVGAVTTAVLVAGGEDGDRGGSPSAAAAPSVDKASEQGREPFEATCAVCHGRDLKGTSAGPPFLDRIYEPSHHPDESFRRAVEQGVRAHHWSFGDMPAQPNVSDEEIERVIAFVRAQQRRVGIS